MDYKERVGKRLKLVLDHHPYVSIEYLENSFQTVLENRNPNMLGNFAGGDMAYAANAAAGLQCVAEGVVAQTASLNLECIARGEGDVLVSRAEIVHRGSKLIRLRCDVFVRKNGEDKLVAIAQANMSPMSDQDSVNELISANSQTDTC